MGVRGAATSSPTELLRRVEAAVSALREADETWDFGILEDADPDSAASDAKP